MDGGKGGWEGGSVVGGQGKRPEAGEWRPGESAKRAEQSPGGWVQSCKSEIRRKAAI